MLYEVITLVPEAFVADVTRLHQVYANGDGANSQYDMLLIGRRQLRKNKS